MKLADEFKITDDEYELLDSKFGDLCNFAAWQLLRKNTKNNHTNEIEDVIQENKMHLLIAGAYYKRQVYIESSLGILKECQAGWVLKALINELCCLWENRKRHGAHRQKFGEFQELLLDKLLIKLIPEDKRPSKRERLKFDSKFVTYCKSIVWNSQKTLGKKITKEKGLRTGQVSLSSFDYLGSEI